MPQTIPPFVQYQEQMVPLRGLWNTAPAEGEYFVNFFIDWGSYNSKAVQVTVAGNSPVALSQIVCLVVDNSRCGSDIDFLFPDSGFSLTIPAHNGGVFPVLTNALMFYAVGMGAGQGDTTVFQALNSMPPPVMIQPSETLNNVSESGIPLTQSTNAYITLLPATASGLLTGFAIQAVGGETTSTANLDLVDGTGKILWAGGIYQQPEQINVSGLNVRFHGGIKIGILGSDFGAGTLFVNLYYTTP